MLTIPTTARAAEKKAPLKIALLPIVDALPYYVAEKNGFFDDLGVAATAVPVGSGLERDQLMQSGEIDGMLNEMTTTANFNRDRLRVKIVISVRKPYAGFPLFRVLSAPGSGLASAPDLSGVPIGISRNTIIEYVTDRLLAAAGLAPEQIIKKSVPVIPERYQLLLQGRLKAATLPDPLAKSALEAGAGAVADDSNHPQYSVSVLSFNVNALRNRAAAVRAFLKAWDRATAALNANPGTYRSLLLNKIRVPENVKNIYKIPPYPRRQVPSADQWADVMHWMKAKGLLNSPLLYRESVTTAYLP